MSKVAIITARGGSKRIPKKNIKLFRGRPIISYSIEAALGSGLFDEVMVSTDNPEIAHVAQENGAKIPFIRSEKNSSDSASTVDALLEVLASYEKMGMCFEYGCCIYPTAPFLTSEMLRRAHGKMIAQGYDTVFPVVPFGFPIQRAVMIDVKGRIRMFQPQFLSARSQDLETAYHDAGQYYWFKVGTLIREKKLWTENSGVVLLDELRAHDIDTLEDWAMAEFKFQFMSSNAAGHV